MNRRQVLKLGVSAGVLTGAGLYARGVLLPPRHSRTLAPVRDLAARLVESLDEETRARVCVDYDHPLRQYHNRGVRGGGLAITSGSFSRRQRSILTDLLFAGLSEAGRERVPEQFFVNWPGVHLMNVLVCGDPTRPPYQIVLSGPHLNLRLGGQSREGVAFGGPQVYGDQRGNGRAGLPRNVYRYQFQTAWRLFESLTPAERQVALSEEAPIETRVELQGRAGSFPGVAVGGLSDASRDLANELVRGILSSYPPEDVAYARECLDRNGGVEALFAAWYRDGRAAPDGPYQVFRLEGPAAVFYFKGHPHVHAYVNVGMDGDRPLSVGEKLGDNPAVLEGAALKRLFEDVLLCETGADCAWYPAESAVGRLRPGTIRTGDVYALESWQDVVCVLEIRGANLREPLLRELRAGDIDPAPERVYSVATTGYAARELASEQLGKAESRTSGILVRDAAIAYLRDRGFPKDA